MFVVILAATLVAVTAVLSAMISAMPADHLSDQSFQELHTARSFSRFRQRAMTLVSEHHVALAAQHLSSAALLPERRFVALAGLDAHGMFHIPDEYFAVTGIAGVRVLDD